MFLFIDADCVVHSEAVSRCRETALSGEQLFFGSYTRETRVAGFLTKFKNLQHHFTHLRGADYLPAKTSSLGRKLFNWATAFG